MQYTKKDFELIASVISTFEAPFADFAFEEKTKSLRAALAEAFADKLKNTNPDFDKKRFMAACQG